MSRKPSKKDALAAADDTNRDSSMQSSAAAACTSPAIPVDAAAAATPETSVSSRKRKSDSSSQQQEKRSKLKGQEQTIDNNHSAQASASALVAALPPPSFPTCRTATTGLLELLDLRHLHRVAQLSRRWYNAVKTIKPLERSVSSKKLSLIPHGSAVARHISEARSTITGSSFRICPNLGSRLPNLISMTFDFSGEGDMLDQLVFPPLLESFCARVDQFDVDALGLKLVPLSRLRSLTLKIHMEKRDTMHKIELACFLPHPFPLLKSFRIDFDEWYGNWKRQKLLSTSVIEFIRQSRLTGLSVKMGPPHLLHKLFEQITQKPTPCPLLEAGSLRRIQECGECMLYMELLQILVEKFPSIQSFGPNMYSVTKPEEMKILSRLPNITELDCEMRAGFDSDHIVFAVWNCPKLTHLRVEHLGFSSDDLRLCLSKLPHLTSLELTDCGIGDISALAGYGLPQRLKALEIHNCELSLSNIAKYILPLKKLEHLVLDSAGEENLPGPLLDQLYDLPLLNSWDLECQDEFLARRGLEK